MKYARGWVVCLQRTDGQRFPNGSEYLYSEPHSTKQLGLDWAAAFADHTKVVRMEENDVALERLVLPREQLELWAEVGDKHTAVMEFLQWMEDTYDIRLDYEHCREDNPAPLDRRLLVDKFFGLDHKTLEYERRLAANHLRQLHPPRAQGKV